MSNDAIASLYFTFCLLAALTVALPAVVVFIVLRFHLTHPYPSLTVLTACALAAGLLGGLSPRLSWRLGLIVSSGWWLYLNVVFFAFWRRGHYAWDVAAEAIMVVAVATVSSVAASAFVSSRFGSLARIKYRVTRK